VRPSGTEAPTSGDSRSDSGRLLQWRLQAGVEHDSNVLRAPSAVSDRIGVLGAGLRVEAPYSLQRLTLEADLTARRFDRLGGLNHELLNYRAAWDFSLTPRLRGTLASRQEQDRDLTDAGAGQMQVDRRTDRRTSLQASFEPGGGWVSEAAIEQARLRSDAPGAIDAAVDLNSLRLAGGHTFGSGIRLLAQVRRGEGRYRDAAAGDFRETGLDLLLRGLRQSAVSVDARVGHLRRRHDLVGARDFEGPVGEAQVAWQAGAKTRLEIDAARELGHYGAEGGGRVRSWRLALGPVWEAGAHTTLSLRHAMERQAWDVAATAPDAGRVDRLRTTSVSLQWRPRAWFTLEGQLRGIRRDSSLSGFRFRAEVTSLMARLDF
jgi:hypothetical protein